MTSTAIQRAGKPTDLHLFAGTDHFMFAEENTRVRTMILDWLAKYFPATGSRSTASRHIGLVCEIQAINCGAVRLGLDGPDARS